MFWKKKGVEARTELPKPKKKLSPKEMIINRIEQLEPGQSLTYQLAEYLWRDFGGFVIVELNPQYPGKGQRYIVYADRIADGKPAGQKKHFWDLNKPKDVANWILDRNGVLVTPAGEGSV